MIYLSIVLYWNDLVMAKSDTSALKDIELSAMPAIIQQSIPIHTTLLSFPIFTPITC